MPSIITLKSTPTGIYFQEPEIFANEVHNNWIFSTSTKQVTNFNVNGGDGPFELANGATVWTDPTPPDVYIYDNTDGPAVVLQGGGPVPTSYTLSLQVAPIGGGTATDLTNLGPYLSGAQVSLQATPNAEFTFNNWTNNLSPVSASASFVFNMPATNTVLVANFAGVAPPLPPPNNNLTLTEGRLFDNCIKLFLVKGLARSIRPFATYGDGIQPVEEILFAGLTSIEINEPIGFDSLVFKAERDSEFYGFSPVASIESLQFDCQSGKEYIDNVFIQEGTDADLKLVMIADNTVQFVSSLNFNSYSRDTNFTKLNLENSAFDHEFNTQMEVPFDYTLGTPTLLYSKSLPQFGGYNKNRNFFFEDFDTKPLAQNITRGYGLFFEPRENNEIKTLVEYPTQLTYISPLGEDEGKYVLKPVFGGRYKFSFDCAFTAYNAYQYGFSQFATTQNGAITRTAGLDSDISMVIKVFNRETLTEVYTETIDPTQLINNVSLDDISFSSIFDPTRRVSKFFFEREFFLSPADEVYVYLDYTPQTGTGLSATDNWGGPLEQYAAILQVIDGRVMDKGLFDDLWMSSEKQTFVENPQTPSLQVEGFTLADPSVTNLTNIGSALSEIVTGMVSAETNPLKSDLLLTVDGELYKFFIGNGFAIKSQVDPLTGVTIPRASFAQLMEGIRFLVNAGYNVEFDALGYEKIAVEKMEYFFAHKEILTFLEGTLEEYEEASISDRTYNEIEVGYRRTSKSRETNKTNTIEDPHGVVRFKTPIKRNKQLFDLKTDFILSAFEIEITRRKQFEEQEGTNSNEREDSSIYGVQVHSIGMLEINVETINDNGTLIPVWETRGLTSLVLISYGDFTVPPFVAGDSIEISYNGIVAGTRTVNRISYSSTTTRVDTEIQFTSAIPTPPNEPLFVTLRLRGTTLRALPESVQPFEEVTGVDSPETFYNLRWTPNRVMRNWGKEINAGLSFKDGEEPLTFQKSEANTELATRLRTTDPHPLGDIQRALIVEGANLTLSQLYGRQVRTLAYEVSFKTRQPFSVANYIMACHQGFSADDNNYGFIQVADGKGNLLRGYLVNYEYSPASLELEITLEVKERLPILTADIIRPITDGEGFVFIDENGNYIQQEN